MMRANYIGAPQFYELNQACRLLTDAFGHCVYLVGSSIERRDYRDVDIRCILDDAEFERLFPGARNRPASSALWSLVVTSISLWLSKRTGLPVDFQIQSMTEADAEKGMRCAVGIFLEPRRDAVGRRWRVKVTLQAFDGRRQDVRVSANGEHVELDVPCLACGHAAPTLVRGHGRRIESRDTYAAEAETVCCKAALGVLRVTVETIFGLKEDEEMLVHGRARVYR